MSGRRSKVGIPRRGMSAAELSQCQRLTLAWVACERTAGRWARARRPGERVTLASLYRLGLLERRAWRGVEGDAGAAHEYNFAAVVLEAFERLKAEARP
jgi:hypothetical protein